MARFAIIASGTVTNVIDAPSNWPEGIRIDGIEPEPGIGWSFNGATFAAPPVEPGPVQPPAPTTTTRMTQLGFIQRMTADEWGRFEAFLAGSVEARFAKAKFDAARDVDVARLDVQVFATTLRAVGVLLSDDRVTALLAPIDLTSEHALP